MKTDNIPGIQIGAFDKENSLHGLVWPYLIVLYTDKLVKNPAWFRLIYPLICYVLLYILVNTLKIESDKHNLTSPHKTMIYTSTRYMLKYVKLWKILSKTWPSLWHCFWKAWEYGLDMTWLTLMIHASVPQADRDSTWWGNRPKKSSRFLFYLYDVYFSINSSKMMELSSVATFALKHL